MNTTRFKMGLALALGLVTVPVHASDITFNGFASFVAGQTLEDDEGSLYEYDDRLGFQESSLFGLQMRADLQDKLSATAQIIAKGSSDYDAEFNWAYLQYDFNDELSMKVGRSRNPLFMYSDFLDVGYAYHWITPPGSVYSLGGLDSIDGVNLTYQTNFGGFTSKLSGIIGAMDTEVTTGGVPTDIEISNQWVLAWSLNYDAFTFRATYSESEVTVAPDGFDTLVDTLSGFGATQQELQDFVAEDDKTTFSGLGFSYDNGTVLFVSEFTRIELKNSYLFNPSDQWYVSGGYRFGDFMVYLTYEQQEQEYDQSILEPLQAAIDAQPAVVSGDAVVQAQYASGLNTLRGTLNGIIPAEEVEIKTASIGIRYNFHPAACFKIEYLTQETESDGIDGNEPSAIAAAIDLIY